MIYLDSAATSMLKPRSVYTAAERAMRSMASPGRGAHKPAMMAADKVFECRMLISELFNVSEPERVVFTLNATHALNIAIRSLAKRGDRVLISGYEHNSVTRVLYDIGAQVAVVRTPLFDKAASAAEFALKIPSADLVVCNHVSNVFGFIQPIDEIAALCRASGVPLIVDASQSAGVIPIDFDALRAAFIAMPGHKGLLGPQGTGVLLCGADGKALLCGGTGSDSMDQSMPAYLPDRLEAGTHNVTGIAGLAEGVRYVKAMGAERIGEYEKSLCALMSSRLRQIKGVEVFAGANDSQSGVLSIRHRDFDTEYLCAKMGDRNVAARCGMHCAPLAHKTAGTIDTGTVRLSFSPFNSRAQVNEAASIIENIIIRQK